MTRTSDMDCRMRNSLSPKMFKDGMLFCEICCSHTQDRSRRKWKSVCVERRVGWDDLTVPSGLCLRNKSRKTNGRLQDQDEDLQLFPILFLNHLTTFSLYRENSGRKIKGYSLCRLNCCTKSEWLFYHQAETQPPGRDGKHCYRATIGLGIAVLTGITNTWPSPP